MAEVSKNNIFRQKSLDSISSPEQLNDYLRVTNPGIWVTLAAVMILLAGLFVWSMVGNLETLSEGVAVVEKGTAQIMVLDSDKGEVKSGMTLRIGSEESEIARVEYDEYGRTVAFAPVSVPDGKYDVRIVTESIHPIKFLLS